MRRKVRARFWVELALGLISALLLILTILVPDWAEEFLGIEPDQGSGAFELGVTAAIIALTVIFLLAARFEYGRAAAQAT